MAVEHGAPEVGNSTMPVPEVAKRKRSRRLSSGAECVAGQYRMRSYCHQWLCRTKSENYWKDSFFKFVYNHAPIKFYCF